MVTGLTVASAILILASDRANRPGLQNLGIGGFILAAIFALYYVVANRRWLSDKRNYRNDDEG